MGQLTTDDDFSHRAYSFSDGVEWWGGGEREEGKKQKENYSSLCIRGFPLPYRDLPEHTLRSVRVSPTRLCWHG